MDFASQWYLKAKSYNLRPQKEEEKNILSTTIESCLRTVAEKEHIRFITKPIQSRQKLFFLSEHLMQSTKQKQMEKF